MRYSRYTTQDTNIEPSQDTQTPISQAHTIPQGFFSCVYVCERARLQTARVYSML